MKLDKPVRRGPGRRRQDRAREVARGGLGRTLIRLQCYEGLDEAKALYEWEYGKQLLYTQVLREKIGEVIGATDGLARGRRSARDQEDVFFSESFLVRAADAARDHLRASRPCS